MISLSPSAVFPSVGLTLTGEFASLDDPTDGSGIAVVVLSLIDGPNFVGSKRRVEPRDPTRKLKLSILKFISWSIFATTGARVG
jgi:hypothetical protein